MRHIYSILILSSICLYHLTSCSINSNNTTKKNEKVIQSNISQIISDSNSLQNTYIQAIFDYIAIIDKDYSIHFDTIYLGNRQYGQEDDFPAIKLPDSINHSIIRLISPEQGLKTQYIPNKTCYINLVCWADKGKTVFMFVTFSKGMMHTFDATLNYVFNTTTQHYSCIDYTLTAYTK